MSTHSQSSTIDFAQAVRSPSFEAIQTEASALGANAVVGVDIDYEVLGEKNGMLMVSVSGTAVQTD
jgi:uncharacterized protein YbjQ (UPF0145 family)